MVHKIQAGWYTAKTALKTKGLDSEASGSRNTLRHADSIVSTSYEVPGSPEMPECPGFGTRVGTPSICEVILHDGTVAIVDSEDCPRVSGVKWYRKSNGTNSYAYSSKLGYLHRFLLGLGPIAEQRTCGQPPQYVDHINGDSLDCRKCNLRRCSISQNNANSAVQRRAKTSRFKGVSRSGSTSKWKAKIQNRHLGWYASEESAALAYDRAALQYFGEFARLNFPAAPTPEVPLASE